MIFHSYVKLPEGNQKTGKTKEKTPCARLALSVFVFFLGSVVKGGKFSCHVNGENRGDDSPAG